ncbi:MAG: hypothetical protein WC858_04125 [Parcubacteria group bacterium]|jgi:MoaA/NifB/PqqE/SkfB family radical SAM enzyme
MDIIHDWEKAIFGKISEPELFRRLAKSYPPLLSVTFTRKCILQCHHCIYPKASYQDLKLQNLAKIDQIIGTAFEAGIRDLVHVGRILEKEHLPILKKYYNKGMRISLIDNGSGKRLLPEIKKIGLLFSGGVDISLDGNKEAHERQRGAGAWNLAMEGIKSLSEVSDHISVTGTASSLNYHNIVKSLYKLRKANNSIKLFQITTTSPVKHHTQRMHLTKHQMRKVAKDAISYSKDFELQLSLYRFEDIASIIDLLKPHGKPKKKYIHIEWQINKLKILYYPASIVTAEEIAIDSNGRHVSPFGLDHHLAERPEKWEIDNDLVLTDPDKSYELLVDKYHKTLGKKVFQKEKGLFKNIL